MQIPASSPAIEIPGVPPPQAPARGLFRGRALPYWLLLPGMAWLAVFFVIPLVSLFSTSLQSPVSDNPDDGFDLDFVPHKAKERQVEYGVNNTFGFGGHNVSLIFRRYA